MASILHVMEEEKLLWRNTIKHYWFKEDPRCQNCKKIGHVEKTCWRKKNHQANFSKEKYMENNSSYIYQEETRSH